MAPFLVAEGLAIALAPVLAQLLLLLTVGLVLGELLGGEHLLQLFVGVGAGLLAELALTLPDGLALALYDGFHGVFLCLGEVDAFHGAAHGAAGLAASPGAVLGASAGDAAVGGACLGADGGAVLLAESLGLGVILVGLGQGDAAAGYHSCAESGCQHYVLELGHNSLM